MSTPTVSDLLCFDLYSTSRQMTAAYRPLLDEHDLTYPQYLVLLALWEQDGQSVKELAARLRLDYGTLSPLVKRLEAHGRVTRARNPQDERSTLVTLTPAGAALRPLADRLYEHAADVLEMEESDLATLRRLIGTVRDRLAAAPVD
ncbi:MAG: MarR family transcriptional regulator [Propionibacteriales bacterium]|nr:MarR family transcriptional regulator [Propionibacteriales bacterium]